MTDYETLVADVQPDGLIHVHVKNRTDIQLLIWSHQNTRVPAAVVDPFDEVRFLLDGSSDSVAVACHWAGMRDTGQGDSFDFEEPDLTESIPVRH